MTIETKNKGNVRLYTVCRETCGVAVPTIAITLGTETLAYKIYTHFLLPFFFSLVQ